MARPEKLVKRSSLIPVRVTPLEKTVIEIIAEKTGLSVSDLMRKSATNITIHRKFTAEEIEAYEDLHTFYHNFGRITNLVKGSKEVTPELLNEIKEVRALIFEHLQKFAK